MSWSPMTARAARPRSTGHGIAGLEERVHGLGGTFEVSSPDGGPTVVTAHLPYLEA